MYLEVECLANMFVVRVAPVPHWEYFSLERTRALVKINVDPNHFPLSDRDPRLTLLFFMLQRGFLYPTRVLSISRGCVRYGQSSRSQSAWSTLNKLHKIAVHMSGKKPSQADPSAISLSVWKN